MFLAHVTGETRVKGKAGDGEREGERIKSGERKKLIHESNRERIKVGRKTETRTKKKPTKDRRE